MVRTQAPPPKYDDFLSLLQGSHPDVYGRVTEKADFDAGLHNSLMTLMAEGFINEDECISILQSILAGADAHGKAYGSKMMFNGGPEDPDDDGDDTDDDSDDAIRRGAAVA